MELRIQEGRAVLAERDGTGGEEAAREVRPEQLPLGAELAAALHEWARVGSAVQQVRDGRGTGLSEPGQDAMGLITQRGRQLAGRVATQLRRPVHVIDPVTGAASVAVPDPAASEPGGPRHASPHGTRLFRRSPGEPTPWGSGLTVSAFTGVIVFVGMLALGRATDGGSEAGWHSLAAALLVTLGLAPSLLLGRRVPVLRWVCFGSAAGLVASWMALLVTWL